MTPARFLPSPTAETAPYWHAAARGELAMPYCLQCGRPHFYPRRLCPFCRSPKLEWRTVSGRGEVHSFTVVHRAPSEAFADEVPYVVAVVALDEGPCLMSRVVNAPVDEIRIGDRLRAVFVPRGEGVMLPCFERDGDE